MNDVILKRSNKAPPMYALSGFILAAGSIATLVVSGIGYRLGWWSVVEAIQMSEWAAYAAMLGLVLSLVGSILSWPGARRRGFVPSLLGLAMSLPVTVMAMQWEYATRTYPAINDISTDMEDPPVFWDMPNPTVYPGEATAEQQRAAYPDLKPLELAISVEQAYAAALEIAKDEGWEIIADELDDGRIEAVVSSFLYGFKDEIIIRITPSDGGATVDVRSRSRTGRIDRGVNAKRIRAVLAAMRARVSTAKAF
jgi:uncharacterized protein (DUF1499 family)